MLKDIEVSVVARQVGWVLSAGFGRPIRSNADVQVLIGVCRALASDETLPELAVFEDALTPSVTRLGNGDLGELAQIELGLHPRTRRARFLKSRRQFAKDHFEIGDYALARLERAMCLALAEDLMTRLEEVKASEAA
jgi:hypothetical protein